MRKNFKKLLKKRLRLIGNKSVSRLKRGGSEDKMPVGQSSTLQEDKTQENG